MFTLKEAATVNAIRESLRVALRTGDLYLVREAVIDVLARTGSGNVLPVVDQAADTQRCVAPDFEPDSAPAVARSTDWSGTAGP